MATNTCYLVLLCCIASGHLISLATCAGYTKTVCTSTSCTDYSIKCFMNGVIAVQNVWMKENETCGSEAEMYYCCCKNHLTGPHYLIGSALEDLKQQCDSTSFCRLWPYIYNGVWKMTVDYDCVEVTESTRNVSSTGQPNVGTSEEASPEKTTTPFDSASEEPNNLDSSTALPADVKTIDKAQGTSTISAEVDVNTTDMEGDGYAMHMETDSSHSTAAIVAAVIVLTIVCAVVVAVLRIKSRRSSTERHTPKQMIYPRNQAETRTSRQGNEYVTYENNDISHYENPFEHRVERSSDAVRLAIDRTDPKYTNIKVESKATGQRRHVAPVDNLYCDLQREPVDNEHTYSQINV